MRSEALDMALSRLGDFIELVDLRNSEGEYDTKSLKGISINKVLTPTKADTSNLNLRTYKILKHNWFTYCTVTSRNGNKISLAYNDEKDCIVSSINPVFKVKDESKILPRYLMMFFNRPEFDRFARFNSWGSARETFCWDDFCNIELEIPSLVIQKKYVAIYESMLANLRSYEKGLDDLKLVCEGYIEKLQSTTNKSYLGGLIVSVSRKNVDNKNVMGVCSDGIFTKTKANISNVDLSTYSLVKKGDFAYNPSRINLGSIALCDEECIVSPMYEVFSIKDSEILDCGYLHLLLTRKEFLRSTSFFAIGSVRDTFDFDLLSKTRIPLPNIDVQKRVVAIYEQIKLRKSISVQIKNLMNNLIPVLIRGSILEARIEDKGL